MVKDPRVLTSHEVKTLQQLRGERRSVESTTDSEGVGFLYNLSAKTILKFSRHESIRSCNVATVIPPTIDRFEAIFSLFDSRCLPVGALLESRILKRKHYYYCLYLAALTSSPILYKVANGHDLQDALMAKAASVVGIKALDNINDCLHTKEQAIHSLYRYQSALLDDEYILNPGSDRTSLAENSVLTITRAAYDILRQRRAPTCWRLFREDAIRLVEGQMNSFDQKWEEITLNLDMRAYLDKIIEKSIGGIWIDTDLCIYEDCAGRPFREIDSLRQGADYLYKSCLLYDDVTDLYDDLRDKIINSAVLLAMERGSLTLGKLTSSQPPEIYRLLLREGILKEILRIGDEYFRESLKHFGRLSDPDLDRGGLIFSSYIMRVFLLRKLLMNARNLHDVLIFLRMLAKTIPLPYLRGVPIHI